MSKDEINKILDQFSRDALEELLAFLRQLEQKHGAASIHSDNLQKILFEDKELLQKLAQ